MSQNPKPLLVLDLDNTLVYCSEKPYREAQMTTVHGHLSVRDHLDTFLRATSSHYDLMVWSNGGLTYVKDTLEIVWPSDVPLKAIIPSSVSQPKVQSGYGIPFYKNMRKLLKLYPEYDLNRIVGVDDLAETYKNNYGNLVVVREFVGQADNDLLKLKDYLIALSALPNFRDVEKRYWRSGQPPRAKRSVTAPSQEPAP